MHSPSYLLYISTIKDRSVKRSPTSNNGVYNGVSHVDHPRALERLLASYSRNPWIKPGSNSIGTTIPRTQHHVKTRVIVAVDSIIVVTNFIAVDLRWSTCS